MRTLKETAVHTTIAWAVAWCVMVVAWPWAHANPVLNPIRAVVAALSFPESFPVLFEGALTLSDALPRYYSLEYLAITTPLVTLALTAVGLAVGARELLRRQRTPATLGALLVAVWLLAPLAFATLGRPNVYDGLRHLLFALPALALLAGIGASAVVTTVSRWLTRISLSPRRPDTAIAVVMALVISLPRVELVRLHPYQSSYFNIVVGGLAGAGGRYEVDYWLSSYREAMEWVNSRAAESGRPVTVLVAADSYSAECADHFAGAGVTMFYSAEPEVAGEIPQQFDYYLSTTRYGLDRNFSELPVVHRIEREGSTLTLIRGRARSLPGF